MEKPILLAIPHPCDLKYKRTLEEKLDMFVRCYESIKLQNILYPFNVVNGRKLLFSRLKILIVQSDEQVATLFPKWSIWQSCFVIESFFFLEQLLFTIRSLTSFTKDWLVLLNCSILFPHTIWPSCPVFTVLSDVSELFGASRKFEAPYTAAGALIL